MCNRQVLLNVAEFFGKFGDIHNIKIQPTSEQSSKERGV